MVYKANEKVNKIIDDFKFDFAVTSKKSREKYLMTLSPGTSIPKDNRIFDPNEVKAFQDRSMEYRAEIDNIFNDCIAEIKKAKTASPSSEAVNVISLLSSRDNVSAEELNDVINEYGDNYQIYRACQDISNKNHLGLLENHPLQTKEQNIQDLQSSIDRIMNYSDACKNADNGLYSFIQYNVDSVLSD